MLDRNNLVQLAKMYSNIRLLDCINRPDKLIEKAFEMGKKLTE